MEDRLSAEIPWIPRAKRLTRVAAGRVWQHGIVFPFRQIVLTEHRGVQRFFAKRCTHLAGMVAYFGMLSVVPVAFLCVSALAVTGQLSTQGYFIEQVRHVIPSEAVNVIRHTVDYLRNRAGSLGVIGAVGLVWTSSNFLSCIESALNIIYDVDNRPFLKQKALVVTIMFGSLSVLVAVAAATTMTLPVLARHTSLLRYDRLDALASNTITMAVAFLFFFACYRVLCNVSVTAREVWKGAAGAAILFEISVHMLPFYLAASNGGIVVKAFAGALIVMVWFYLSGCILLAGAVFNWWWARRHTFA